MKIILTPHRDAVALKPGERLPTPEEQSASIAAGRRAMAQALMRRFPQVKVIGIEGKGEILVELPDDDPDLPARIRAELGVESGPAPGSRPDMPVWRDIPPSAESVAEAYARRDYRPTVMAIIRDEAGRLLLVQAARNAEWGVVQGGIEEGESPLIALARELREEIDVGAEFYAPSGSIGCAHIDAAPGTADHLTFTAGVRYFIFEVAYRGSGVLKLQKEELSDYAWVEPRFDDLRLLTMLAGTRVAKCRLILGALVRILA